MREYDHKKIEKKWQDIWEKKKVFQAKSPSSRAKLATGRSEQKKFYALIEFPYPSGEGLHVGHPRPYIGMDIISRKRRMEGFNVLYPIGWDAFGLPTENYAIKTGKDPRAVTKKNSDTFRRQIKSLGVSFDWSREINTTDPKYYKWTQWIFLQFLKKSLAYKAKMTINWCPKDKIGLANEEVVNGCCERCGTVVEKREKEQWLLAITKYADRLDKDLDGVDYLPQIKLGQRNWIGRSEGAEIDFPVKQNLKQEKNALVIHGINGHVSENWFPWIKETLEKKKWNVSIPLLPNSNHPIIDGWNHVLQKQLKENAVVIGHSMGVPAALNLIQTSGKKVDKLILVAPVNPNQNWQYLKKTYPGADWDAVKNFADIKFDWNKISKLVNNIIFYYSDNDEYIPQSSVDFYKKNLPNATFRFFEGKAHFNRKVGITQFPEILDDIETNIKVFTTRPDTIFGATYLVLAPEHELVKKLKSKISNWDEVLRYIVASKKVSEIERTGEGKIKTGVELKGVKAINPATKEEISIWIADYVLTGYGTGAIMAVPAHDERDFEFAKKYNLPVKQVIEPAFSQTTEPGKVREDLPIEHRNAIIALVKHWSEEKYIALRWKKVAWVTFITGGVEEGQTPEEAARMEIREETGFKNLKLIKNFGRIHGKFYHVPKKVNRYAHSHTMVFELQNDEREEIKNKEKEIHDVTWLSRSELERELTPDSHLRALELLNGKEIYSGTGILINSGKFSGMDSEQAKKEIIKFVGGKEKITFKLRDWIFSRQRYWGEPIPVIFCEKCGVVPVPEKDLPVELPKIKNYQPTDSGESPLANITKWVNVKCPKCGGKAKRETDTMPNWAGSSWYYLRYTDPKNAKAFASEKNLKYWLGNDPAVGGVNWYNGGNEHTTLHLLYSRFWHKFLYDLKLVPTSEPYMKRTSHGMILGEGGVKMSKSLGNVINPDEIVKTYGADTLRVYEMFMGPFDQSVAWSTESIIGARRFIEKVWRIGEKVLVSSAKSFLETAPSETKGQGTHTFLENSSPTSLTLGDKGQGTHGSLNFSQEKLTRLLHKTIKKVSEDIEEMHFNTAISSMMILATEMEKASELTAESYKLFLQILSPFAPHVTEELWQNLRTVLKEVSPRTVLASSINFSSWPKWDENLIKDEKTKIVIQINGKVRAEIFIETDEMEENIKEKALKNETVLKYLNGKETKRIIYVKNRLVNIVA